MWMTPPTGRVSSRKRLSSQMGLFQPPALVVDEGYACSLRVLAPEPGGAVEHHDRDDQPGTCFQGDQGHHVVEAQLEPAVMPTPDQPRAHLVAHEQKQPG